LDDDIVQNAWKSEGSAVRVRPSAPVNTKTALMAVLCWGESKLPARTNPFGRAFALGVPTAKCEQNCLYGGFVLERFFDFTVT